MNACYAVRYLCFFRSRVLCAKMVDTTSIGGFLLSSALTTSTVVITEIYLLSCLFSNRLVVCSWRVCVHVCVCVHVRMPFFFLVCLFMGLAA